MTTQTKQQILRALKDEFNRWEELLEGLTIEQITDPVLPSGLSIKDVIGHLHAWQQRSIARMEAALDDDEPVFPLWPDDLNPDREEDTDKINAWLQSIYGVQPWGSVFPAWKAGFLEFVQLGEEMPEADMFDPEKYAWLQGHTAADVLLGSYEHHHIDHYEPIAAWLEEKGVTSAHA
jgi:hypothetical protein